MDITLIETLRTEELIEIEERLKNSVTNLHQLITELYNENHRLSYNNTILKNLADQRTSKRTGIAKELAKSAFWNNSKILGGNKFIEKKNIESSLFTVHKNHSKINLEQTDTNDHENGYTSSGLSNTSEARLNISKNPSNTYVYALSSDNSVPTKQGILRNDPIFSIGDEYKGEYTINMLVDQNEYVRIRFSNLNSENERETFVREIIRAVGLKAIYFDCIKTLLKSIERKGEKIVYNIDIADLDPWNFHYI
ncbi:hypothetical protein HWI79_2183 [Cryptosporidium felis]|nr:hypothetical protein HWI79_2183 [Cryptosporidium felis]